MPLVETSEPVENRQQEIMNDIYLKLGFLGGALSRPEVMLIIQTGAQSDAKFKGNLTYLRDLLSAAIDDDLPVVRH